MRAGSWKVVTNAFRRVKKEPECEKTFDNLVGIAREIAAEDIAGLHAFVVAILRPLQAQQILAGVERSEHSAPPTVEDWAFFMGKGFSRIFSFSQLATKDPRDFEVDLARDLTLPTMWNRQSIVSAFGTVGAGLRRGPWRQDPNHQVTLWLPWRLAFVTNGNHSITAGILRAEGKLIPSSVYDLTPQLRRIRSDGVNYFEVSDGKPIAKVHDQRLAAVWEIGRLMAKVD